MSGVAMGDNVSYEMPIMALMTPLTRSAVISLRISGNLEPLKALFPIEKLKNRQMTKVIYKSLKYKGVEDELLMVYFRSPQSYTGEDVLELFFHGNPLIVSAAMEDLTAVGVRHAEAGEFTMRAFTNGKITLAQAEAVNALIKSNSYTGIKKANRTLHGGLDKKLISLREKMLDLLAVIEADIDSDEEINSEKITEEKLKDLHLETANLIDGYEKTKISIDGPKIVIAGKVNSGKSTLFNALVNENAAIVTNKPGTTRDLIIRNTMLKSINVTITDTAGLRKSSNPAEKQGISRAKKEMEDSDIVIWTVEPSDKSVPPDIPCKKYISVATKADLNIPPSKYCNHSLSAISGEGMAELKELLVAMIECDNSYEISLINARQYTECKASMEELSEALAAHALDVKAFFIKRAIEAIDRLKGENVTEETLSHLFKNFCIGK
jgi:tRNA modification GTPase